ncbi:MAG: membrane protein insertion efficiency factor YidD [Treponema sp.]|nr:membrane protein insertion efficiency factor YidD [Treponema sp.]
MSSALLRKAALLLIRFYQYAISPYVGPCCRYVPSCSAYAFAAIEKYGFFRGGFLALKRLLRCHPFHAGGYDSVP